MIGWCRRVFAALEMLGVTVASAEKTKKKKNKRRDRDADFDLSRWTPVIKVCTH